MRSTGQALGTLLAAAAMALSLAACDNGMVFYKYSHAPTEGWEKNDTVVFDVPKQKHAGIYRLDIGLRTNEQFPFTSISLVVEQTVLPQKTTRTDTLKCRLADEKGNILGRGINHFQYDFALSDLNLKENDSLHVSIRHIMKRETLPGISDIGLKVTKK